MSDLDNRPPTQPQRTWIEDLRELMAPPSRSVGVEERPPGQEAPGQRP